MSRDLLLALLLLLTAHSTRAQAANDDIENRRVVRAEETITSNTTGCTVQRTCVDERLTGKCIEYHNDQWFEFTPKVSGRYFVNIGGQRYRDMRGVQLVVLVEKPCQPATYQVLSCTSLGTQDDVFVTLDSLHAGMPYLLDVNGYLKYFYQFTLQVSEQAAGAPAVLPPSSLAGAPLGSNHLIRLERTLPDSLATAPRCRVLRRELREFRSGERARSDSAQHAGWLAWHLRHHRYSPPSQLLLVSDNNRRRPQWPAACAAPAAIGVVQPVESAAEPVARLAPPGAAAEQVPT